jgi:subtilisin family serine protease
MAMRDWFQRYRPVQRPAKIVTRSIRSFSFECLESRALMSAMPVSTDFAARADGLLGESAQFSMVDAAASEAPVTLQRRLAADQGDYYFSGSEKTPLWRHPDQFVINVDGTTSIDDAFAALLRADAALANYDIARRFGATTFAISARPGIAGEIDSTTLSRVSGIDWATPLFQYGENGSWLAVNDEVIVALKDGVAPKDFFGAEFASWRRLAGTNDQFVATLAEGAGAVTLGAANRLHQDPRVQWAMPNGYADFQADFTPSDPQYSSQWHLNNTGQTGAKVDADSDLSEAWDATQGNAGVVIAVIDDGVQVNHPDLNIWVNPGEIAGNGLDDDGNGWIDDVNGWNFVEDANPANDNNPNPAHSLDNHGTAVAGVAAAAGNAVGVSGTARNARILPVKVSQGGVFASYDRIAEATYYAAGRTEDGNSTWKAADILNMSFGANGGTTSVPVLDEAIEWATDDGRGGLGATVIASAGNAASGTTQGLSYEAYSVTNIPAGNYIFEWRYEKSAAGSAGLDSAWLANVQFPNGTSQRFDAATMPAGWTTSGTVGWSIMDDPTHAYGTGRYVAKAGTIGNSATSRLRSPSISLAVTGNLMFNSWASSELGLDGLRLYISSNGGANFSQQSFFRSGLPSLQTAVTYPANLAEPIAVGASTDWDYRSMYSQFGSALDVVAPSNGGYAGITTTDRTGSVGYNSGDYTSTFGGTSSSAPMTAGIAALLLTKNPHLTPTQIRNALQNTADKIGGNNGQTAYVSGFNQFYGYGRVNAAAALAAVPTDTLGPRIGNVTIKGSASTHLPFAFNRPDDATDFDGSGIQLRTVPVGGADTISIQFGEHVPNITSSSLTVRALTSGVLAQLATTTPFTYDEASYVATWKFSSPFATDQQLITLSDAVVDAAGNALDGEWTNPFSVSTTNAQVSKFPSGNGSAGGAFKFVFTILPGDANLNNYVEGNDFLIWQQNVGGSNRTFTQADYNGDGLTNNADNTIWQSNSGRHLVDLVFADFNHDGIVDSADLSLLLNNFGQTNASHAQGDVDDDGSVNGMDWLIWQRQSGLSLSWVA